MPGKFRLPCEPFHDSRGTHRRRGIGVFLISSFCSSLWCMYPALDRCMYFDTERSTSILCPQNARFEDVPGKEQCRIKSGRAGGSLTPTALASLWGVDQKVFEAGVMRRTVTAGGTSASVALNAAQVCACMRPFMRAFVVMFSPSVAKVCTCMP